MIVDSSAVLAILKQEPDAARFSAAIATAERPVISAANWLEAAIVADGAGDAVISLAFDRLVSRLDVVPVTASHAAEARRAYRAWGKGHHRAALNFGDCFAYALAQERGEPLLFKGKDFARTDVRRAT